MKRSIVIICAAMLAATAASAQTQPPAQSGPGNNAVNSSGQNNSTAPVAGRNSFTEGQAKSKIEDAGFSNVTRAEEGRQRQCGVAKPARAARSSSVSVDFQGNVNTAK